MKHHHLKQLLAFVCSLLLLLGSVQTPVWAAETEEGQTIDEESLQVEEEQIEEETESEAAEVETEAEAEKETEAEEEPAESEEETELPEETEPTEEVPAETLEEEPETEAEPEEEIEALSEDDPILLPLDQETTYSIVDEDAWFSFTPDETGAYAFRTTKLDYANPHMYVYDEDGDQLSDPYEQDYENDRIFSCFLEEQQTYKLQINCYDDGDGLKITAKHAVTVTFDPNGGSFKYSESTEPDSMFLWPGTSCIYSEEAVLEDPRMIFVGWGSMPDATEPSYVRGEYYDEDAGTHFYEDTTYYAIFEEGIKVTAVANHPTGYFWNDDGDQVPEVSVYVRKNTTLGELADIYELSPSNDDWEHVRDSRKRALDPTGAGYYARTPLTEDTTVYVIWDELVFVTFDANGGTFGNDSPTASGKTSYKFSVAIGNKIPPAGLPNGIPSDSKKVFVGWSLKKTGTRTDIIEPIYSYTVTKAVTFYAVYATYNTITATVSDSTKGTVSGWDTSGQYVSEKSSIKGRLAKGMPIGSISLYPRAKDGYCFLGWSKSKAGTTILPDTYVPAGNESLYAIFAEGSKVTFGCGYEEGAFSLPGSYERTKIVTVKTGETLHEKDLPVVYPSDGLQFVGWKDAESDSDELLDLEGYDPAGTMPHFKAVFKEVNPLGAAQISGVSSKAYTGNAITQTPVVTLNGVELVEGTDYKTLYLNNTNAGVATLIIIGIGEYGGTLDKQFNITPKKLSTVKVTLKSTALTYTGKTLSPGIKSVKSGTMTIGANDYTFKYSKTPKAIGTYTVTVTVIGNYSGTAKATFKINPKGTTIASITAASKGFTVKWKKQATQTTGYQIRYSTSSKMTSAKTVTISKNTTVSKKITGLKAKKKYYVQVRTYKTVGKTKYYSAWSTAKSVTTKS